VNTQFTNPRRSGLALETLSQGSEKEETLQGKHVGLACDASCTRL